MINKHIMASSRIWISVVSILVIVALTVFLYGYTYYPIMQKKHHHDTFRRA